VTETTAAETEQARQLREAMTDKLVRLGAISSPVVEAAFRAVPREAFALPGTSVQDCYSESVVRLKKDADGVTLSSISAPWLQASMIAQAGIGAGARVLEVGTTGYNAALIAEVTGPGGFVVTIDIDPEITARASAALQATGYGDRVTVLTGDGAAGAPGHGPFDAVIITAGAWDIPPPWTTELAEDGTLVVPLRMNGVTRSLGLRKAGRCLAGQSAITCGFIPMQGASARAETIFTVSAPGGPVLLRFEDSPPPEPPLLENSLASEPAAAWSGLTIADMTSWEDIYLWLAGFQPGFCRLDQANGTRLAAGGPVMRTGWFPFAIARDGTLSYLTVRQLPGTGDLEFGALAYGPNADTAAATLIGHLHQWDARGRALPPGAFAYWPAATQLERPGAQKVSVFPKRHGTATITWPDPR